MNLVLEKENFNEYLKATEIIDFETKDIIYCANSLVQGLNDEVSIVKRIYEFVSLYAN